MTRLGRPPKSKADRRDYAYSFRVTPSEGKRIERARRAFGHRTATAWIRDVILSQANAVTGAK